MTFILPQNFYARDALIVARELLGKIIVHEDIILRITETEAYRWPHDSANHCYRGETPRNSAMFGPPGHLYVYLCYGLHHMLNIVSNNEHEGAAVLIRSCEVNRGHETILRRRGLVKNPALLTGPGKVAKALGIDRSYNGHALYQDAGLQVYNGPKVKDVLVGPRVGINYAETKDRLAPYRFADAKSVCLSEKRYLEYAIK